MILDEAYITIEAGKGGGGHVSFRREKYIPKGGPDGGDGGRGGSIFLKGNSSLHALINYASKKYYKADDGRPGGPDKKYGKSGDDLHLDVPPGTQVFDVDKNDLIIDITEDGQEVKIAKGGKGGLGNVHFKSSTNQTPKEFTYGQSGQKINIKFELKMIADIGLIGFPNAGKSTLLSRISQARPKIADYPFTTLEPNLGMVRYHDKSFVVADIPGLISGASTGKGLGHKFLKHIERTKILAHIIDPTENDIIKSYADIREELSKFSEDLILKDEIIIINKVDTIPSDKLEKEISKLKKITKNKSIFPISAVTGNGIDKVLAYLASKI